MIQARRGQRKKHRHRAEEETQAKKEEKAQAQKEESYGGGKQTTTNGWLCCRYPESRQEDWSGLPTISVEGWNRNCLLSILFSQVKRKPEQAQAPSEKIPKLDLGQVSLQSMLKSDLMTSVMLVNHCSFASNSIQLMFNRSGLVRAASLLQDGSRELRREALVRNSHLHQLLEDSLRCRNFSTAFLRQRVLVLPKKWDLVRRQSLRRHHLQRWSGTSHRCQTFWRVY